MTERVDFRDKPLPSPTATALPKGEPLAKRVGLVLIRQRQEEASVKLQTFRLCQSLSLSGEVARRSRDGEGASGTNPLSLAALDSSPEGRALGKEGRSRPHSSTAGRSQPLSCKLYASAKASPFRERWHGEAVTERVSSGTNPLSRLRRQLSRRESPWQRGQVSSSFVNGRKKPAVKLQTFRLCQSLSLSGEVARRSRDGEGCLPRRTLSVSLRSTALPKGEPLAEPVGLVLIRQRQNKLTCKA